MEMTSESIINKSFLFFGNSSSLVLKHCVLIPLSLEGIAS